MTKSKRYFRLWPVALMATSVALSSAMAQERTGNGGGSWVCREADGSIRWTQVVDLFEVGSRWGLKLQEYGGTPREIVAQVMAKLAKANNSLAEALVPFLNEVAYLEHNPPHVVHTIDLPASIPDSHYEVLPDPKERCPGGTLNDEQVVYFGRDGIRNSLQVKSQIFVDHFDAYKKAGMIVHEAVYLYRRTLHEDEANDSRPARRITGLLFSDVSVQGLRSSLQIQGESELTSIAMKFVPLPKGTFLMGSTAPEHLLPYRMDKIHEVSITLPVEMQATEVTQLQYSYVMGQNPSRDVVRTMCPESFRMIRGVSMCPNRPVEYVTHQKAVEFTRRLNAKNDGYFYRLPTEAEWEYAARAGRGVAYVRTATELMRYGWIYKREPELGRTYDVALLSPNAWGLYDMIGNVAEWGLDIYDERYYLYSRKENPGGPVAPADSDDRAYGLRWVLRGGSAGTDSATVLSETFRGHADGPWKSDDGPTTGFRVVRIKKQPSSN